MVDEVDPSNSSICCIRTSLPVIIKSEIVRLTTAYGDKYHEKEFANVYLHSVRTRAANEDLDPRYNTF